MKNNLIIIICLTFIFPDTIAEKFKFNQSTIQGFYFVIESKIYGIELEEDVDWIIAYNDDICIGARRWAGPYTDIPVMGDDGSEYSKGYIKAGEIPNFKIYDTSEDILYDANPSEKIPYPKGMVGMITLNSLNVEINTSEINTYSMGKITEITNVSNNQYQIYNNYKYNQPKPFRYLTNLPYDLKEYSKIVFNKKYIKELTELTLATGLLIYYDAELIKVARHLFNEKLNISYKDEMQIIAKPLGQPIRVPSDLGSALYFIGDGWTHFGLSMSFYLKGKLSSDNRALQTSSQILQGMVTAGFVTQVIKHITGRTSPFKGVDWDNKDETVKKWNDGSTDIKDRWEFFPNQIEYHKYVSSYDAFPSGHLAVFMSTLTVITENYPEYPIIKPIGYTLMTLLGLQMMNNGVHWVSDYPLSIAMGYYLGKIAVNGGREPVNNSASLNYQVNPYANSDSFGLNFTYYFNK